jgi:hypothetical protein
MKNERIELRASPEDKENLETAKQKAGKKGVSETIRAAIKNLADQEPKPEKVTHLLKESYFRNICSVHSMALPHLKRIAEAFKKLDIGPISLADMEMIEARDFTEIKTRYNTRIESGVPENASNLVRNNLLIGSEEGFFEFQTISLNTIQSFDNIGYFMGIYYPLSAKHFTIQNNEVTFTDENREFLKSEYCTIYLETPDQFRFVELQEQGLKILTELKALLLKHNTGSLFSTPGDMGLFDEGREDVIIGAPEFVEFIKE